MKRMNVSFNKKAYEALIKMEEDSGIGKSEILRNAIALLNFVEEKKEEGYKLTVVKNNVQHEIIIP